MLLLINDLLQIIRNGHELASRFRDLLRLLGVGMGRVGRVLDDRGSGCLLQ